MMPLRWVLALSVAWTLFGNHYARDSVASLERQMEDELSLTPVTYNRENSVLPTLE
jgi:hypothetical protein